MDRCTQLVLHPLRNVQPVQPWPVAAVVSTVFKCEIRMTDADNALETALRILEATNTTRQGR